VKTSQVWQQHVRMILLGCFTFDVVRMPGSPSMGKPISDKLEDIFLELFDIDGETSSIFWSRL